MCLDTLLTGYEKAYFVYTLGIVHINCVIILICKDCADNTVEVNLYSSAYKSADKSVITFSFQLVEHYESADRATTGDTCGPVRPALQKGMWLLRQRSMAGSVLQVLEGGVPAGTPEADPG